MIETNRILLQLDKAISHANSEYIQDRSIAVILFDNLIEIQLHKISDIKFGWDRTTWYNGVRTHDYKTRKKVNSYHKSLLKFSKDNNIINESDYVILNYAHTIRNEVYHVGLLNELKVDLAILLYYNFVNKFFSEVPKSCGLIAYTNSPSAQQIDFGQGIENEPLYDYKNYYLEAIKYILPKFRIAENLDKTVVNIITQQLNKIKQDIELIQEKSKSINFYNVLSRYWYLNNNFLDYFEQKRKPRNIDSILLMYLFLRKSKDELDDIRDLRARQKKGRRLLRKYRSCFKGKYPFWIDISIMENRVEKLKGKTNTIVMQNLVDIEKEIYFLFTDISEASRDLDFYIQEMIDDARGK